MKKMLFVAAILLVVSVIKIVYYYLLYKDVNNKNCELKYPFLSLLKSDLYTWIGIAIIALLIVLYYINLLSTGVAMTMLRYV